MKLTTKASLLFHILRWRLTWDKRDTAFVPKGLDSKRFISAQKAAKLIEDGHVVFSNGMAGNARCSIMYWAVKERFLKTGHPKNLTWIKVGAQGSRGRVPGTIEEVAIKGLMTRYIGGHLETEKAQLRMADRGELQIHTLPQGQMTFLLEAMARGEKSVRSTTGVGTFLDPRVGNGSKVSPNCEDQFIKAAGDELEFTFPCIDVTMFNAPYADLEGNIYYKHAATLTENTESAMAAKACGGKVIALVGDVIEKNEAQISLDKRYVDYIVVNPHNEQTGSIEQRRYWPMFTENAKIDVDDAVEKLKFANNVLKITPVRSDVDNVIARLAAKKVTEHVKKGSLLNFGVGLPEEVGRLLYEYGAYKDLVFSTETGVYGGLPGMGIFFGASIAPIRLETSAKMFHRYLDELDVTILGFLQVDSLGNVNVSNRGPKVIDYVGPGGLPDITNSAKAIVFIGSWMANARFQMKNNKMTFVKKGRAKFVKHVDEITFSGQEALKYGKKVYYISHVGLFELRKQGLTLIAKMPGIDIEKDVLGISEAKINIADDLVEVGGDVVSGDGYQLKIED